MVEKKDEKPEPNVRELIDEYELRLKKMQREVLALKREQREPEADPWMRLSTHIRLSTKKRLRNWLYSAPVRTSIQDVVDEALQDYLKGKKMREAPADFHITKKGRPIE